MSVATLTTDLDWRQRGNCRDEDPDTMHPEPRDRMGQEQAKAVCDGCPVAKQCFDDGIRVEDWYSVRAGMTGEERLEWHARRTGRTCNTCAKPFNPRIKTQKKCRPCGKATDGHRYGAPRRTCNACGTTAPVIDDNGRLARHRVPGHDKRRQFCRGEAAVANQQSVAA